MVKTNLATRSKICLRFLDYDDNCSTNIGTKRFSTRPGLKFRVGFLLIIRILIEGEGVFTEYTRSIRYKTRLINVEGDRLQTETGTSLR